MPDKKLTDNEIKKALELCFSSDFGKCEKCPLERYKDEVFTCMRLKQEYAINLINRLQEENERLQKEVAKEFTCFVGDPHKVEHCPYLEEMQTTRAKALKEAASKFAGHSDYHGDTILCKLYCMAEGKEVENAKPLDTSKIKAEAYKEFAYELMQIPDITVYKHEIKNLLKEKVGENDAD